jgi:hypothetical protein
MCLNITNVCCEYLCNMFLCNNIDRLTDEECSLIICNVDFAILLQNLVIYTMLLLVCVYRQRNKTRIRCRETFGFPPS